MSSRDLIHMIDDDQALRDSVMFLGRSAGLEVQSYASPAEFLARLQGLVPGCVVTDVRMPGMSGIELLRHLREHKVAWPVIVVTGHGEIQLAVEAMKLGAVDFLEKPFDDENFIATARGALERWRLLQDHATQQTQLQDRLRTLSGRERDVLTGLLAGRSNKMIAIDLDISPRTVEIYRANLMTKMQAASLSELVRLALLGGMAPPATAR